jgi:hypothetical protein
VSGVDDPSADSHGHAAVLYPYFSVTQHGGPASRAVRRSPNVALGGHATHGVCPGAGGGAGVPRVGATCWDLHGRHSDDGSRLYGSESMVAHDVEKLSEWFILYKFRIFTAALYYPRGYILSHT